MNAAETCPTKAIKVENIITKEKTIYIKFLIN